MDKRFISFLLPGKFFLSFSLFFIQMTREHKPSSLVICDKKSPLKKRKGYFPHLEFSQIPPGGFSLVFFSQSSLELTVPKI